MPDSDFFAFCTSLQLRELKSISELSRVRQVEEDDHVYSAGDEGDELFIINRGLAQITPEPAYPGMVATMLSRGDIFGESGAFLHLPRNQTARARAPLSVQCFRGQDFPELARRVPSFFLFLCDRLTRHLRADEMGRSQNGARELVGNLANFDVITIYQTIMRSMQTGLLTIADEKGDGVCELYFDRGTLRCGRFQHLSGDEAFWQLFIQTYPGWTFFFSQKAHARADWPDKCKMSRNSGELLIKAIVMRDEFEELQKLMSNGTANLKRQQLNFVWPRTDLDELRPLAEEIWQIAYNQPISLADLCQRCNFCDLKIYRAVDQMVNAGLFVLHDNGQATVAPPEEEVRNAYLAGAT
jgi:CRP-like cAMP-binding protein